MSEKKEQSTTITFKDLGLSEPILKALEQKGFIHPTPIQALTIPALLEGDHDIVGQAQTGTGKTAAFALPLIERLQEKQTKVQALVLAPTRELALQVADEFDSLKGSKKLSVLPVYGGQSITVQLQKLRRSVDVVVGTPGRVMDHLKRGTLDISEITHVVLDEADEMLNMGFLQDVEEILQHTPENKQVLLFSATMAPAILSIAKKYLKNYDILKVAQTEVTNTNVEQIAYDVPQKQRFNALCRIIDSEEPFYGLIFCRTKRDTEQLSKKLTECGYHADALNGDMSQSAREKILEKFKKRFITILAATDVAARGIDVKDVTHVINYALPDEPEAYVHRIGRTGRAGKKGKALSFVSGGSDRRKISLIERKTNGKVTFSPLPTPEDIIANKRAVIVEQVTTQLARPQQEYYISIAHELLQNHETVSIVATLLKRSFRGTLDTSRYTITEEPSRSERSGRRSSRSSDRSGERPRRSGRRQEHRKDERRPRKRADRPYSKDKKNERASRRSRSF